MIAEKDFKEFIELLNKHNVKYLIVGGFAFSYYAEPRYTKDIDIFINAFPENVKLLMNVMKDFGFGAIGLSEDDFLTQGQIIQLGNEPVRIDIINSMSVIDFESAWENRNNKIFLHESSLIKLCNVNHIRSEMITSGCNALIVLNKFDSRQSPSACSFKSLRLSSMWLKPSARNAKFE